MLGLTIASQKGGVGKTTVALNVAFALARRGWRTLIVDTDPAGAVGLSLTKRLAEAPGLAEYLSRTQALSKVVVQTKLRELSVLPVGRVVPDEAMGFESLLADGGVLRHMMGELSNRYDVVVFDTPSGFGGATLGAMAASRYVLCPVQAEPIAARSVLRTLDLVGSLRQRGIDIDLLGFLVTMLQASDGSSRAVADELARSLPPELMMQTSIPRDASFLEASAAGVPVGLLRRRAPPSALVFDQLAAEIEDKAHLAAAKGGDDEPIALVD